MKLFFRSLYCVTLLSLTGLVMADDMSDEFIHGIVLEIDDGHYYFGGVADGPDGAIDVPGHSWIQDDDKVLGKHYNTGPFGAESWWSSDAPDGALLYAVEGRIDEWSEANAIKYFANGFTHYHHLVNVDTGETYHKKVVWLKHVATGSFNFDRGPAPELGHVVEPGVDFQFAPNWMMPFDPMGHM